MQNQQENVKGYAKNKHFVKAFPMIPIENYAVYWHSRIWKETQEQIIFQDKDIVQVLFFIYNQLASIELIFLYIRHDWLLI